MMRTPTKTILLFILIMFSCVLLTLGANLWFVSKVIMEDYEGTFITIGTVQQKQTAVEKISRWDAGEKDYQFYAVPTYGAFHPLSILDFEGANYVLQPEKRPVYFAYSQDFVNYGHISADDLYQMHSMVIEVKPLEDGIPDAPMKMQIMDVKFGRLPDYITTLWLCDHYNDNPQKFYAEKTYIMLVHWGMSHRDLEGIFPKFDFHTWDEVAEGFYETENGKRWLSLIEALGHYIFLTPVTPTQNTNLLMPFYNGEAFIKMGRDISEDEYQRGDRVCLVPRIFAERNDLTVGSTLKLSLYYADYGTLGRLDIQPYGVLNDKGEVFQAFEIGDYTVVGIYDLINPNDRKTNFNGYEMVRNEIVIPSVSVKNDDKENIVSTGPMMGYTTSFQIENGSIDQYMVAWNKLGIDDLEIRFYDRGYSQLKAGMENMRSMSQLLLISGIAMAISILLLFCHLFISKQKRRAAIERSLGVGIKSVAISLLAGVMVLTILGCIFGSFLGWSLTGQVINNLSRETYYSTDFSAWAVNTGDGRDGLTLSTNLQNSILFTSFIIGSLLIFVSLMIASFYVRNTLKTEVLAALYNKQ